MSREEENKSWEETLRKDPHGALGTPRGIYQVLEDCIAHRPKVVMKDGPSGGKSLPVIRPCGACERYPDCNLPADFAKKGGGFDNTACLNYVPLKVEAHVLADAFGRAIVAGQTDTTKVSALTFLRRRKNQGGSINKPQN